MIKTMDWNEELKRVRTNRNLLKSKLALVGMSEKKLAEAAGISYPAYNKKIVGKVYFTVKDIFKIAKVLSLTGEDIVEIFFSEAEK